jgi:hypothetical protein
MKLVQGLPDNFIADFRGRFLPLAVGMGVLATVAGGYLLVSRESAKPVTVDPYTQLLRTGVIDVTRPSPTDPNITEVVRFLPDGRVQVLERIQTRHFLASGARPPPPRESRPLEINAPAAPQERVQGLADTFQRR